MTGTLRLDENGRSSLEHFFKKYLDNGTITIRDQELIEAYLWQRQAKKHMGEARKNNIGTLLIYWRRFLKVPYEQANLDDIYGAISEMCSYRTEKGEHYRRNTQRDYIVFLKGFLRWLCEKNILNIPGYERELREISTPSVDYETTRSDELLMPEDIKKFLEKLQNVMHRAFIATLYESAARPGECARLQYKDLVKDEYGIGCYITDTKTSKRRWTLLTFSAPYLSDYMRYRGSHEMDDYVFANKKGSPLKYSSLKSIVYRASRGRANLGKRVWLYLFRKSRITQMYRENMNDAIIKEIVWGNQATLMTRVYVKLNHDDIKKELLRHAGIEVEESTIINPLAPKTCHRCHTQNKTDAKYCDECGRPLNKEAEDRQELHISQAQKLPGYMEFEELKARIATMEREIGLRK